MRRGTELGPRRAHPQPQDAWGQDMGGDSRGSLVASELLPLPLLQTLAVARHHLVRVTSSPGGVTSSPGGVTPLSHPKVSIGPSCASPPRSPRSPSPSVAQDSHGGWPPTSLGAPQPSVSPRCPPLCLGWSGSPGGIALPMSLRSGSSELAFVPCPSGTGGCRTASSPAR